MNKSKKGQITLFLLLGIVILGAFGFIFYLSQSSVEGESIRNENQLIATMQENQKVKAFVESCLDESIRDALYYSGMQGGILYNYQTDGGVYYLGPLDPDYNKYGNKVLPYYVDKGDGVIYNVSYILNPRAAPLSQYSFSKDRPLEGEKTNKYYFGEALPVTDGFSNLKPLCTLNGTNKESFQGARYSCETYGKSLTIQKALEGFVLNHTLECVKAKDAESKFEFNVTFPSVDNTTVQVLFGEEEVETLLYMPIKVQFPNTDDNTGTMSEFITRTPIRFKKVYELAFQLLKIETSDIFHNLKSAGKETLMRCENFAPMQETRSETVDCYRDNITVTFVPDACNQSSYWYGLDLCNEKGDAASFLVIEDHKSRVLFNQPFKFVLAIGNRGPVMDPINYKIFKNDSMYTKYLEFYYNLKPNQIYQTSDVAVSPTESNYDVIVDYEDSILLIPRAIDPDEEFDFYNTSIMWVDYIYGGWKSQENGINLWHNSNEYKDGILYASAAPEPRSYHKDASYKTKHEDVGHHTVTISVKDRADNIFTQEVNIQVRCKDELHGFALGESKVIAGELRHGDYNLSNYANPDTNDANDCCNERGGYVWYTENQPCGIGKVCNNEGKCVFSETFGSVDCGPCRKLNVNADPNSVDFDEICPIDDSVGGCGGLGVCCNGVCKTSSDIVPFYSISYSLLNAYANNATHNECWIQTPQCAKGLASTYPELNNKYVGAVPAPAGTTCGTCATYPCVGCLDGICKSG